MKTPLPDEPACWRWSPPQLPQPNDLRLVQAWQAGRCAICARTDRELYEDHDHQTLNTRGYLCPRCNAIEGLGRKGCMAEPPVFAAYRARPPVDIFGICHRYGQRDHPDDVWAVWRLHYALTLDRHPEWAFNDEVVTLAASLAAVNLTSAEHFERNIRQRRAAMAA